MNVFISFILGLFLLSAAHADEFVLKSPEFSNNEKIPILYTCNGKNISPPLEWENPPTNTKSYVLTLSCSDSGCETPYNWVLYNIPYDVTGLPQGASNGDLPHGTSVGDDGIGEAIYRGPCPPSNLKLQYIFTLYALDKKLNLFSRAEINEILAKMKGHVLNQTQLTVVFSH